MNNQTNVLIIGAGPTGLLLACQLAWRGVRLRIVEKNQGPSRTSKALAQLGWCGRHGEYGEGSQ